MSANLNTSIVSLKTEILKTLNARTLNAFEIKQMRSFSKPAKPKPKSIRFLRKVRSMHFNSNQFMNWHVEMDAIRNQVDEITNRIKSFFRRKLKRKASRSSKMPKKIWKMNDEVTSSSLSENSVSDSELRVNNQMDIERIDSNSNAETKELERNASYYQEVTRKYKLQGNKTNKQTKQTKKKISTFYQFIPADGKFLST